MCIIRITYKSRLLPHAQSMQLIMNESEWRIVTYRIDDDMVA